MEGAPAVVLALVLGLWQLDRVTSGALAVTIYIRLIWVLVELAVVAAVVDGVVVVVDVADVAL